MSAAGAERVVWSVANQTGLVPIPDAMSALPAGVRAWVQEWLASSFEWCGHIGESVALIRPFGARRAVCPRCAYADDIDAYLERCGRCGVVVGRDGFGGVIARGTLTFLPISLCRTCWIEGGGE